MIFINLNGIKCVQAVGVFSLLKIKIHCYVFVLTNSSFAFYFLEERFLYVTLAGLDLTM